MIKKGFTLIELITTIGVIAILVLLASPRTLSYLEEAKTTRIKYDIKIAEQQVSNYFVDREENSLEEIIESELNDENLVYYNSKGEKLDYSEALYDENDVYIGPFYLLKTSNEVYTGDISKSINSSLKGMFISNSKSKVYYVEKSGDKPQESSIESQYERVLYVDSNTIEEGQGTKESPYKSIKEALSNSKQGDLISLNEGTYTIDSFLDIYNEYDVDIIGEGIDTILEINEIQLISENVKNKIFRLTIQPSKILQRDEMSGRALISSNHYNEIIYDLEFHNILFRDPYNRLLKNTRHSTYLVADASSGVEHDYNNYKIINSASIDMPIVSVWNDKQSPNIKIINSVTNVDKIDSPNDEYGYGGHNILSKETSLSNVIFSGDYNIISHEWENKGTGENKDGSQANIGLYGGKYSW